MLISCGLQVAPLPPLSSGASRFPHHFPVSLPGCCWDTGGCSRARSGDAAPPLACLCLPPCMVFIAWSEYMQMLQWCPVKGNTTVFFLSPPVSLHFPRSFPFCFFPKCCPVCSECVCVGGSCGNQLGRDRFALSQGIIYRTHDSWLLITRQRRILYIIKTRL